VCKVSLLFSEASRCPSSLVLTLENFPPHLLPPFFFAPPPPPPLPPPLNIFRPHFSPPAWGGFLETDLFFGLRIYCRTPSLSLSFNLFVCSFFLPLQGPPSLSNLPFTLKVSRRLPQGWLPPFFRGCFGEVRIFSLTTRDHGWDAVSLFPPLFLLQRLPPQWTFSPTVPSKVAFNSVLPE